MSDDKAICEEALEVIRAIIALYDEQITGATGHMVDALIHEQYGVERAEGVLVACMERRAEK